MRKTKVSGTHFKRYGILLAAVLVLFCCPLSVAADQNLPISNEEFLEWGSGTPAGWELEAPDLNSVICEQREDGVYLETTTQTYAYLTQEVPLESQTSYKVTCNVTVLSSEEETVGFNVNFGGQVAAVQAEPGLGPKTVELWVNTNVDEEQTYTLRFGIGEDYYYNKASVLVENIRIDIVDEVPADVLAYTLIGSIGSDYEPPVQEEEAGSYPAADVTYDDIGVALCGVLAVFLVYWLTTGRYGVRFGQWLSRRGVLISVFVLAFLLRLFIALQEDGHVTDLDCFAGWALQLEEGGLESFYISGGFADYPPAYMFVLYAIGWLVETLGLGLDALFVLVRIPAILADLALGYVIYRMARPRLGKSAAALLLGAVLASPALITDSAAWGQVDSIFILALVACFWLLYRNQKIASCAVWMLCFLIKPQAAIFAPILVFVFLADLFSKKTWKRTLIEIGLSLVAMLAVYAVLSLPFKAYQGFFYVFDRMLDTVGYYQYGSLNAFNLFALTGGNFAGNETAFLFTDYKTAGTFFIAAAVILTGIFYFKKRDKKYIWILGAFMMAAIFLFAHNMHERYLLPVTALLLVAALLHNSRAMLLSAAAMGAVSFLNMFTVLIYVTESIPYEIVAIQSALALAAFAWLAYVTGRAVFGKSEEKPILKETEEAPAFGQQALSRAEDRLLHVNPHKDRRMTKKDVLVMLAITVVYGAVALINLGSPVIPARTEPMTGVGDSLVLELPESTFISELEYYAGYGEGEMVVSISEDGVAYTYLDDKSISHPYADMFRCQFEPIGTEAKYLRLTLSEGEMEFREIALYGPGGQVLPVSDASWVREGVQTPAPELIDEPQLVPYTTTYMTEMYFDEVYHARTAYEYMENLYPYEVTHPPLGKSIITIGIQLFGYNPFGWRFMGALFGILQLPLLYILGKRIFKKTLWAAVATGLFATDFMHYALTRIATIDSYSIFFILAMSLCMYEYTQHNFLKEKLSRTLLPLGLCGLAWGLGCATKWLCVYAGVGLFLAFFYTVYQRCWEYKYAKEQGMTQITQVFVRRLILTLAFCVLLFILVPIVIYVVSYLPYETARPGFGLAGVWENQTYMLTYHGSLVGDAGHPFASVVYTWPFNIRPVFFFQSAHPAEGSLAVINCFGNPLLWWAGLAAVLLLIGNSFKGRLRLEGAPFVALMGCAQILPWLFITREVFIYHYFASLPFLIFGLVYVLRYAWENWGRKGKILLWVVLGLCIALFVCYYPMITGTPVSRGWSDFFRWLPTWPFY